MARPMPEHKVQVFYERYFDPLFRMAYRIVGSYQTAEDIVHDVFVAFIRAVYSGRIDEDAFPAAYLFSSVKNASLNCIRKRANRLQAQASAVPGVLPGPSIDHLAVASALVELPEEDQTLLALVSFAGLSVAEIAEILRAPEPTIRKRIQRARARLVRALDPSPASSTHDR